MDLSSRRLVLIVAIAFAVVAPAAARAQDGRIAGRVYDVSGTSVAGVTVAATNAATGATRTAVSGTDGRYAIGGLAPGRYSVGIASADHGGATVEVVLEEGGSNTVDLLLTPVPLSELTVTAMLREQEVFDVPFSIAAPTARDLRARGADDLESIAANVAGFTVQNLGPGQSQPAIRGASAGQIARDQPGVKEDVGVYLDGTPVSLSLFTPDLDLFDVARVEVLRGPQGTLFGAGSVSGTVRYITNPPELGVSSVFGETSGRAQDGGALGGTLRLGANAPLGDRAAVRIAAYRSEIGGYMDAVRPDLAVEDDVNGGRRTGVRGAVLIVPHERVRITPRVVYQRAETDGWNRSDDWNILANPYTTTRPPVTLGDRQLFLQLEEPYTDDFVLADIEAEVDLGSMKLTSVTSRIDRDILVVRDGGALYASVVGGSFGLPEPVYTLDVPFFDETASRVWSQELRLAGGGERVRWLVGGFYSDQHRDFGQSVIATGFEEMSGIPTMGLRAATDQLFFSDLSYRMRQFGLFGEGTVDLSERLSLTGGLRVYRFDEEREQVFDGIFGNPDNGNSLVSSPGETEADGVAPRVIAAYELSDDVRLSGQVSKGFRLGGINDPLNEPVCSDTDLATFGNRDSWTDEIVWNYEVGIKSRLFGGRAGLDIAAYYMDIDDLQLNVTAGSCSSRLVFNVPDARSLGLEIEMSARPTDRLDLAISASLTDAELRSTVTSTANDGTVSVVSGIESGNRLPSVPEFQAAAAATYRWPLTDRVEAFLGGSYQHVGSRITQIDDHVEGFGTIDLEPPGEAILGGPLTQSTFVFDPVLPAYDLVNLRVGVTRGRWELSLFGANLTDERAFLALDRERGGGARIGYLTNPPRSVGLQLRLAG